MTTQRDISGSTPTIYRPTGRDPKACPACSHGDPTSSLCNECEVGAEYATDLILDIIALSTDLDHVINDEQAQAINDVIRREVGRVE